MIARQSFDNRHRSRNISRFVYLDTLPERDGMRFEEMVLDPDVGSEIVLLMLDRTNFGVSLAASPTLDMRLKIAEVQTTVGSLLVFLWWFPPIRNGQPFAANEHVLNPSMESVLHMLRRLEAQTCLHVLLIGNDGTPLNLFECPNTFGIHKAVAVAHASSTGPPLAFTQAKREYEANYAIADFFREDLDDPREHSFDVETAEVAEDEEIAFEDDEEVTFEDGNESFILPPSAQPMIESAAYLAARLCESPERSDEERSALAKALYALVRLPRSTRHLNVVFGISHGHSHGDLRYWEIEFCETSLCFKVGGSVNGPLGHDSYSSFRYELFIDGGIQMTGDFDDWYSFKDLVDREEDYNVCIDDLGSSQFWSLP